MNQTSQPRQPRPTPGSAATAKSDVPVATQLSWLRQRWSSWAKKKQPPPPAPQSSRLLEASAFAAMAEQQLRGCLRRKRHLSLAVFEFKDLVRLGELHGTEVSQALKDKVLGHLAALAGTRGAVALIAPDQYAVLLPGVDRPRAVQAIHRIMGQPACVRVEAGDATTVVLMAAFEVECANNHDASVAALQRELCRDLKSETPRKAQQKEAAQEAIAPERKPILIWPDDPALEHAFAVRAAFPATVPMGLTLPT